MEEVKKSIDLSQCKAGSVFKTKGGAKLKFWYIDYGVYRLQDMENSQVAYSYKKDGTCEELGDDGTLVEFLDYIEESRVTDNAATAVKVVSVILCIFSIIAGIVICGEIDGGTGITIIVVGIIQCLLGFLFANMSKSLKESTAIQKEILKSLKNIDK